MAQRPGDERPCTRCKMQLVFLEGKSGPDRPMPAQRVRSVYQRVGDRAQKLELSGELFVNHYETCPHAASFSRRGQRQRADSDGAR